MRILIVIFSVLKLAGIFFIMRNYSNTLSDIGLVLYITGTVLHELVLTEMNDKIETIRRNKNEDSNQ